MFRCAVLLLVFALGLGAQGLRYRVECKAEGGGEVELEGPAVDDCSGEVLVSGGMSLWRGKKAAVLIRVTRERRERVEIDLEKKTWKRSLIPSSEEAWEEFRDSRGDWAGHEVQIRAKRMAAKKRCQAFELQWRSSRPAMRDDTKWDPSHLRAATGIWLEKNTRELSIDVETCVDSSVKTQGMGWDRVAWGLPEALVNGFVALMAASKDVRDVLQSSAGLAMETRIRYLIFGQANEVTIRVVDVKKGRIAAEEFAIPEGFREEK